MIRETREIKPSLEIVQVTYVCHLKGERVLYEVLDTYPISSPHLDDFPEITAYYNVHDDPLPGFPEKPGDPGYGSAIYIDMPCDWDALNFTFVGQSFDPTCVGGMSSESEAGGADYVFEHWITELRKFGEQLLQEFQDKFPKASSKPDLVNFLTLWEFSAKFYGEDDYRPQWKLLGLMDPAKLEATLKDEVKE